MASKVTFDITYIGKTWPFSGPYKIGGWTLSDICIKANHKEILAHINDDLFVSNEQLLHLYIKNKKENPRREIKDQYDFSLWPQDVKSIQLFARFTAFNLQRDIEKKKPKYLVEEIPIPFTPPENFGSYQRIQVSAEGNSLKATSVWIDGSVALRQSLDQRQKELDEERKMIEVDHPKF